MRRLTAAALAAAVLLGACGRGSDTASTTTTERPTTTTTDRQRSTTTTYRTEWDRPRALVPWLLDGAALMQLIDGTCDELYVGDRPSSFDGVDDIVLDQIEWGIETSCPAFMSRWAAYRDGETAPSTATTTTTHPVAVSPPPTTPAPTASCRSDAAPIVHSGRLTDDKDGDSFDIGNVEVRLAIVDTPEWDETGGDKATRFTVAWFDRHGTVNVYRPAGAPSHDRYGRLVGEVMSADCESLNVALVNAGLGEPLDAYCHEDPNLAARVGC